MYVVAVINTQSIEHVYIHTYIYRIHGHMYIIRAISHVPTCHVNTLYVLEGSTETFASEHIIF